MADEQTPAKRDVNEVFTLGASDPTSDRDGPLAHLLSTSPVSDLGRSSADPAAPAGGVDDLPSVADVSGLEDLYLTTADLPLREAATEPLPPGAPDRPQPIAFGPVEPGLRPVQPQPAEPAPLRGEGPADSDPFRSFEVGGNLRFSTEAVSRATTSWSPTRNHQPYPAPLVPNAVPAPVAPSRSVRVPGQDRRRGALFIALVEITERRWFWASAAGFFGVVLLGVLTVGNIVPNPLADGRTDVVAENRLPAAPEVGGATETSESDTSSSTGAGTGGLQPAEPTTSIESTTSSTTATSSRRIVTTARPTVRSTTAPPPTSTTTSLTSTSLSSTTTSAASTTTVSSSTTESSGSTTTTESTTTDTTGNSSTTETTETTLSTTTESTDSTTGGSDSSGP